MENLEMNTMPSNEMVRPEEKIDVNAACVNIISRVLSIEDLIFSLGLEEPPSFLFLLYQSITWSTDILLVSTPAFFAAA